MFLVCFVRFYSLWEIVVYKVSFLLRKNSRTSSLKIQTTGIMSEKLFGFRTHNNTVTPYYLLLDRFYAVLSDYIG